MARIITVISGKGGVGKTTTVSNLGAALVKQGERVLILDANVTTPNLSLHLGMPFYPVTLHDALKRKVMPNHIVYDHPSGLKVVPASLSADAMKDVDLKRLESVIWNILGEASIIIVDAAAGLGREAKAAVNIADEVLIVTNPDIPSVTDALKTIKISNEVGTKVLGVVVNRHKGLSHEMGIDEIEDMLEVPVISIIPEDLAIPRSIYNKTPAVFHNPRSKAAKEYKKLAAKITGKKWTEEERKSFFDRLFNWLR